VRAHQTPLAAPLGRVNSIAFLQLSTMLNIQPKR